MTDKILRKPEVKAMTGLSLVSVWRLEKSGDFPKRLQLGARSVGWRQSEVQRWIESRQSAAA